MIYTDDNEFFIGSLVYQDIQKLRELRNYPYIWKFLSNPFEVNELEQEKWFEKMSLDQTKQYFLIKSTQDEDIAGCVWYDEWDRTNSSCRIGIFISGQYQKLKVATRVMEAFIGYLREDMNIHRIWLLVMDTNKPAIKLYNKLGFVKESVQHEAIYRGGKYHDYLMMSLIK